MSKNFLVASLAITLAAAPITLAAPKDRIVGRVDSSRTSPLLGGVNAKIRTGNDKGELAATAKLPYMSLLFRPSAAQQADLDQLLVDQQNPGSPNYRKWLGPEQFGQRFGLSESDLSKVTAWLVGQGFKIEQQARSNNWLAFSGTAGQVKAALHTSIHAFEIDGKTRYANVATPSVPEALADIVSGVMGLDDIPLHSNAILANPNYNSGTSHYLAPEDWTTIYNVTPLQAAGIDGTGQSIVIIGDSAPLLSDITSFRTRYGLPTNPPKVVLYGGADPGITGDLVETNLDLEWAGAIAPNATLYYVYGANIFSAIQFAVANNIAPVISVSFGGCESGDAAPSLRTYVQQGAAQGISILASSGDVGAAGCNYGGLYGTDGPTLQIPSAYPEVTAVGGTQFNEGKLSYWAATNDKLFGSAFGYIPEAAWNESGPFGLISTGGGASRLFPRPAWQKGPGLPADNARWVPDISFSAALHDAYTIIYAGGLYEVGGTSASAPSFAGVVALLNHYLVKNGTISKAGLGNLNPQLYRLAQAAPAAFHDIVVGDNIVSCVQGTPGCVNGSYGYATTQGWDGATGLGSADVNALVTSWAQAQAPTKTTMGVDIAHPTVNQTVTATATVAGRPDLQPTGSIDFFLSGVPLGTVPVIPTSGNTASARISFPVYRFLGAATLSALYSGDTVYSTSGTTLGLTSTAPTGAAGIVLSAPTVALPDPENAQGYAFSVSFSLRDTGNTPSVVNSVSVDGQPLSLANVFPSPAISPNGTLASLPIVFYNVASNSSKKFSVSGVDFAGNSWTREFSVLFAPPYSVNDFLLTAVPLVTNQAPSASCPWPLQINLTDISGSGGTVSTVLVGGVNYSSLITQLFGTPRLAPYGSMTATLCQTSIVPPASAPVLVILSSGNSNEITVTFNPPPANPVTLTAPSSLSLSAVDGSKPAQTTLNLGVSDPKESWTVSLLPRNSTSNSWLSVSPSSGVGPAKITVTANGASLGAGAYNATLVVQSPNASQVVTVPVMYVQGALPQGPAISGVTNGGSHKPGAAPGMLMEIYGSNLSTATTTTSLLVSPASSTYSYLPLTSGGVSVTVNGLPAPLLYLSPTQINIQVPFEAAAGPTVIGVNNNGQVAGFLIQVTPSAPGILTDANGNIPSPAVAPGGIGTMYVTGAGDLTSLIPSGTSRNAGATASSLPGPRMPVSISIGGVQAVNQFIGTPTNTIGLVQMNFYVPPSVAPGPQPVTVTINGVTSPAGMFQVSTPTAGVSGGQ